MHSRGASKAPSREQSIGLEKRGRRECRARRAHPRPRMPDEESIRVSTPRLRRVTRHSRTRVVLTVSFVLFPVTGLFCHRRLWRSFRKLDASIGASEPHDFAVRIKRASSLRVGCVHRILLRARDDRETPLRGAGRASCKSDLPDVRSEIFLQDGLDDPNQLEWPCEF
jgi:hypothetical protein